MKKINLILVSLLLWTSGYAQELVRFSEEGKWGFKDTEGNIVIHEKYDRVDDFSEGLALVELNFLYGFIDKTGNEIIPLKYNDAKSFSEGLACVGIGLGKYGFIDKTGHEIIPLKYNRAGSFSESMAKVCAGKCGFIDKNGTEVIPLKYYDVGTFSEGLACVTLSVEKMKEISGYIDKNGNEVIPLKFDGLGSKFSEGLARIKIRNKFGFIDRTGKIVIQPLYGDAGNFSEGLAWVKLKDKYGFIDRTGKIVVQLKYIKVGDFSEGRALVHPRKDNLEFIDKTGKLLMFLNYDYVLWDHGGIIRVGEKGKIGSIDITGRVIYPLRYPNRDTEIIWGSSLIPHIKEINDYRSKLKKPANSGIFQISRPYLVISTSGINIENDMQIYAYSENDSIEKHFNDLKTIIVMYEERDMEDTYKSQSSSRSVSVAYYKAILIYYDIDIKKCIGHNIIHASKLPSTIITSANQGLSLGAIGVSKNEIIKKIESRLETSR